MFLKMELDGLVLADHEFAQLFVTSRQTFNPTFCLFAYTQPLHCPKFRRLHIDTQNLVDLLNLLTIHKKSDSPHNVGCWSNCTLVATKRSKCAGLDSPCLAHQFQKLNLALILFRAPEARFLVILDRSRMIGDNTVS